MKSFFVKNKRVFKKGFTLIEFMVVIGIFVVMTAIILTRYTKLKSNVSIDTLAQDVALSIRKAQLFSVGVRETDSALGKIIPPGYGISVPQTTAPGADKTYMFFADLNFPIQGGNKEYDDMSGGVVCGTSMLDNNQECLETMIISSEEYINATYVNGSPCNSRLDIVFTRPNLTATISCGGSTYSEAKIEIKNPEGRTKSIIIPTAGNIYVE